MKDILIEHNIRPTKARLDILDLLHDSDPLTAEDIADILQSKGAKLSSIYRNLAIFLENNIVTKIQGIDNFAYYQLNDHSHKHHLTCSICKETQIVDICPIHEIQDEIEQNTKYKITNHIFEFVGVCPKCQKEKR